MEPSNLTTDSSKQSPLTGWRLAKPEIFDSIYFLIGAGGSALLSFLERTSTEGNPILSTAWGLSAAGFIAFPVRESCSKVIKTLQEASVLKK